ncbi:MAG: LacI family transcriptional regulator [Chloroflexota bacterium]|nr:LacI family transcriptional regulator [Chloroflexota bacterium]
MTDLTASPRPRRTSRPTIPDVARGAGVSVSAAGRALGGYGYVSQDVRQRVMAAAARLGYRRNTLASSMVTGRTHTLGFIGADIENSFFARAMRGINDVAHAHQYQVILTNSDEDLALERAAVQLLVEKRVDGIIVAPAEIDRTEHLQAAIADGTPIVLLDRVALGLPADTVVVDNARGAETAVAYLIGLGHQRIAVISTGRAARGLFSAERVLVESGIDLHTLRPSAARVLGYLRAHWAAGVPVSPELVRIGLEPEFARSSVRRREVALSETLAVLHGRRRATALMTTDNDMSHGAAEAIRRTGVRVPSHVSMIGFDDLDWATIVRPPLSVVEQPVYELGALAAERLLARINGDESPPRLFELPTRLVHRASTAPPRQLALARRSVGGPSP